MAHPPFKMRTVCKAVAAAAAGVALFASECGPAQAQETKPDSNWVLVDLNEKPAAPAPAVVVEKSQPGGETQTAAPAEPKPGKRTKGRRHEKDAAASASAPVAGASPQPVGAAHADVVTPAPEKKAEAVRPMPDNKPSSVPEPQKDVKQAPSAPASVSTTILKPVPPATEVKPTVVSPGPAPVYRPAAHPADASTDGKPSSPRSAEPNPAASEPQQETPGPGQHHLAEPVAAPAKNKDSVPSAGTLPKPDIRLLEVTAPPAVKVPAVVPAPAPAHKPVWALSKKDETVRGGVERWAQDNGWAVSWEVAQKWPIRFNAEFGSDFLPALEAVAAYLNSQGSGIRLYMYAGNHVIRVLPEAATVKVSPDEMLGTEAERKALPHLVRSRGMWLGVPSVETPATTTPAPAPKPAAPAAGAASTPRATTPVKRLNATVTSAAPAAPQATPGQMPAVFSSSVSLTFSSRATLSTVTGLLSTLLDVEVSLPADVDFPVSKLYDSDKTSPAPEAPAADKKERGKGKAKGHDKPDTSVVTLHTYTGTPKELLDRISLATGMLWELQEKTVIFHE